MTSRLNFLILILSLGFFSAIEAKSNLPVSRDKCSGTDKKIRRLDSQLRAGYSLKKGEKLKQKYRQLKKLQYACRMKRFPTK